MIDMFSIMLTHVLMLIAGWRLLARPDLEDDAAPRARQRAAWSAGTAASQRDATDA
jgi:hypothetical protein